MRKKRNYTVFTGTENCNRSSVGSLRRGTLTNPQTTSGLPSSCNMLSPFAMATPEAHGHEKPWWEQNHSQFFWLKRKKTYRCSENGGPHKHPNSNCWYGYGNQKFLGNNCWKPWEIFAFCSLRTLVLAHFQPSPMALCLESQEKNEQSQITFLASVVLGKTSNAN